MGQSWSGWTFLNRMYPGIFRQPSLLPLTHLELRLLPRVLPYMHRNCARVEAVTYLLADGTYLEGG